MADMAPALTGAAQEAPHRLKLSAPTAAAWKARSGLLLLNGGEKGKGAREDGLRGPEDAPGPGRGMRRSLRGPREAMGPNSASGPPARPPPGASAPQDSATCPSVPALGPNDKRYVSATGPTAPKHGLGPQGKRNVSAPGTQEKRYVSAPGPTAPKHGPGLQERRTDSAPGPSTPKQGPGPQEKRYVSASGLQEKRYVSAMGPTTPKQGLGPQEKRFVPAPGPTTSNQVPGLLDKRFVSASGPQEKRHVSAPGPTTPKHVPGLQERRTDVASGPQDKQYVSASGPTTADQGLERRVEGAQGHLGKHCVSAPGPTAAQERRKEVPGSQQSRVDIALGPQERRLEGASGPATNRERLKGVPGPQEKRTAGAPGLPPHSAPEASSLRDSATCPSVSGLTTSKDGSKHQSNRHVGAQERRGDGPGPQGKRMDPALGPQEKRSDSAPGPSTQAANLGNAKGHLAGQDFAPEPTGRTQGVSAPPAVKPNPSQGCVPGSHASGSLAPSSGPVDSQDDAPVPRVLCSLRAAQMSSRQQELGARARRLCRRLQVIQAKQVERHVRQQLSGLAEMLSERGAAGLPGSPHIELDRLACSSTARLRAAQGGFDSDATESSSGGESDEEEEDEEEEEEETGESSGAEREEEEQRRETRSDRHEEWRWAVERAAIICRWTWLQAQVSDLEFRIRQQTEIYKQIRSTKGAVVLGDSPHEDSAARLTAVSSLNARGNRVPSSCPKPAPKAPSGDDPCDRSSSTPNPSQSSDKQCSRLTPSVENVACQNPPTTPVCDSPGSQKPSRQVNGLINCVRSSASCNGSAEDLDPEEVLGKKRRVDPLSTSPALSDSTCVAARTRPLRGHKKRSLVRSSDVSSLSRKPQKPLSTKCGCDPPTTCILCGCKTYAKTSHPSTMALNERISLMDPCYHPILSFPYDTPIHLHFEALLKDDRHFRASNKLKILKLSQLSKKPQDAARSMFRDDRQYKGVSGPSIQISSPVTPRPNPASHQLSSIDTPSASQQNSASAALKRKRFENSYDIDNIVIPMSLVAASRVEKLQYKEILTPSWRVLDPAETEVLDKDPQLEDLSDEAYQDRHSKNEELERSRWDSWTSAVPQRRGSRSSNKPEGRWTPQTPNSQGSSQQMSSPYHSLNDVPLSLTSAAADYSEPYSTVQCLSVHSRSRVLSWSEDTRSSTPEIPDDEEQVVQPWEHRFFPLSDRDCRALKNSPGTPNRGRTKPDVPWQTPNKPGAWTESVDSGMSTENLTPASKETPLPNSISVVRVRAHSGDKITSLDYFPPRPVNKR